MFTPAPALAGVVSVRRANSRMWWFILIAANVGAVVVALLILVRPILHSSVPGAIFGLFVFLATNAILVPITIVNLQKRLVIDFDHGTLTADRTVHFANEFVALLRTTRTFPSYANMLTLEFRRGNLQVQVDGFAPTPDTALRNEALSAFIVQCLAAPEHFSEPRSAGPMLAKNVIGKQEALALLRQI